MLTCLCSSLWTLAAPLSTLSLWLFCPLPVAPTAEVDGLSSSPALLLWSDGRDWAGPAARAGVWPHLGHGVLTHGCAWRPAVTLSNGLGRASSVARGSRTGSATLACWPDTAASSPHLSLLEASGEKPAKTQPRNRHDHQSGPTFVPVTWGSQLGAPGPRGTLAVPADTSGAHDGAGVHPVGLGGQRPGQGSATREQDSG